MKKDVGASILKMSTAHESQGGWGGGGFAQVLGVIMVTGDVVEAPIIGDLEMDAVLSLDSCMAHLAVHPCHVIGDFLLTVVVNKLTILIQVIAARCEIVGAADPSGEIKYEFVLLVVINLHEISALADTNSVDSV